MNVARLRVLHGDLMKLSSFRHVWSSALHPVRIVGHSPALKILDFVSIPPYFWDNHKFIDYILTIDAHGRV